MVIRRFSVFAHVNSAVRQLFVAMRKSIFGGKRMKFTLWLFAVMCLVLGVSLTTHVQAQTKKGSRAGKQSAKTSTVADKSSIVSIETGVVLESGDVKPVARTQFYLLDDSLENILSDAGLERLQSSSSLVQTLAASYYGSRKRGMSDPSITKADEAIKPHIKATVTTDFNGKGQFPSLKPGTYYLMGVGKFAQSIVIWDLKADLKAGQNAITLDQENAATVF